MNSRSTLSCSLFTITPHIAFSVSSQMDCGAGKPPRDFIQAVFNARKRPCKYNGQREILSLYASCRDKLVTWYLNPSALLTLPALRMDALIRRLHVEGHVDPRKCAAHEQYVDRLTAWFGFRDGPLEKRVQAMRRVIA